MTTASDGFWEYGCTGVLNIQHARSNGIQHIHSEMNEAPNYTLLFQFGLYRRQWDTLTIFYGFLSLTLSPHLPLPSQTKTEQCNNSTIGKYYQKGCFERPRAIVGSLSDPQNSEKAVRILQAAKGKRTTKTLLFYLVWSQSNPSSLSLNAIFPEIGIYDPVKKHTIKSTVFPFPALKPLASFQIITSRSKLSRRSYLLQAWRRLHDFQRWHAFFPRF